jgi:asparagine synthase (glutamine-hydrolysing)
LSRIAGCTTGDRMPGMLEDVLAGARRTRATTTRSFVNGSTAIGWAGTGQENGYEDDELACVVDGAIYNGAELGGGQSDAGLVARLHREHGFAATLRRLNGDFGIALHDRRDGTLWLARDRFGVRPVYYLRDPRGFAFASRTRALLRLPCVSRRIDRRYAGLFAGSHYRTFDNDPDASPYIDVAQLPAAHLLRVRDGSLHKERWWALEEQPDVEGSAEELAERYRELLLDAVRLRLGRASGPAFTLSGGMDSSSVLTSAVHLTAERQHAYSTLYSGSEYDESDEIRSILDTAVERWHQVPVDQPDVLDLVTRMIDAHDEPVATATWLSHFVLCEQVAGDGFGTLFGGLGGDELNAGEYEYFLFRFADMRASGQEHALPDEVEAWVRHHDHPIFRKDWDAMEAGFARLVDFERPGRILPDHGRIERYGAALESAFFDFHSWEPVMDRPFASYLKNRTYQDIYRETAPCCLRAEDRQTASYGLRNCDPFFDHRLVELMFRVPGEFKIQHGVTKRLLRRAMAGLLPEETRTRVKKTGWNAPADVWFAGAGRDLLHDLVGSQDFRARDIYVVDETRRLIDEHHEIVSSGAARENHMMFLWQLVNLELWLRWLDELG